MYENTCFNIDPQQRQDGMKNGQKIMTIPTHTRCPAHGTTYQIVSSASSHFQMMKYCAKWI